LSAHWAIGLFSFKVTLVSLFPIGGKSKMKRTLFFGIALILLFAATAITFAQTTATTSIAISAGSTSGGASSIKTLDDIGDTIKLRYSSGSEAPYTHVAPDWTPIVERPGSITAGDVYYIDSTSYTGDVMVTLYLTNASALSCDYSYLDMQVNVWEDSNGTCDQAVLADGSAIGTVFLTIPNGSTSFILHGNTTYCVTIDGGSYYCIDTDAAGGSLSPNFYLDVSPL
jgi:hypothetical protein